MVRSGVDHGSGAMARQTIIRAALAAGVLLLIASDARAEIGPAPAGEPTVVAQRMIRQNFPEAICPLVVAATRLGDGSIRALCSNRETFRVFCFQPTRDVVAMRCSAAVRAGISGC